MGHENFSQAFPRHKHFKLGDADMVSPDLIKRSAMPAKDRFSGEARRAPCPLRLSFSVRRPGSILRRVVVSTGPHVTVPCGTTPYKVVWALRHCQ